MSKTESELSRDLRPIAEGIRKVFDDHGYPDVHFVLLTARDLPGGGGAQLQYISTLDRAVATEYLEAWCARNRAGSPDTPHHMKN